MTQRGARLYYSIRIGKNKGGRSYNLAVLKRLFSDLYKDLEQKGYFQEQFGYMCVDAERSDGWVPGGLGDYIDAHFYRLVRKKNLWPVVKKISRYSEDDLFDLIEILHDYVSKPHQEGAYHHRFNNCGYHYSRFDVVAGKTTFRSKVNELLTCYESGFEINDKGQVLIQDESGLSQIYNAKIPTADSEIVDRINSAVDKYRESRSDMSVRRIAVRELADVLESLRPLVGATMLKGDENDLFNIANNFAIRHLDDKQKTNFNKNIWYSWIFYVYLATIHALLRTQDSKVNPSK